MDSLFPFLTQSQLVFALFIGVASGFVKGVVGFAMPLVLMSGLTVFISPELALAGLILPTLVSNVVQSLRQGPAAAVRPIKEFRVFLIFGAITLVIAAQLVLLVPDATLELIIGVPVALFAIVQLTGYRFEIRKRTMGLEASVGAVTGFMGGMIGVWGATTVTYLTALGMAKDDQMRVQGVIYGLGAVVLLAAHISSGVLNAQTWPFSAALILPGVFGMWIGGKVSDRIDQEMFRRATLVVLLMAGLNLIRRAVM